MKHRFEEVFAEIEGQPSPQQVRDQEAQKILRDYLIAMAAEEQDLNRKVDRWIGGPFTIHETYGVGYINPAAVARLSLPDGTI